MNNFDLKKYKCYSDISLRELDKLRFCTYVIDFNWNYLFVNNFVGENLGMPTNEIIGENMWERFKVLAVDRSFNQMRTNAEKGLAIDFTTTSPINAQRLHIVGRKLEDCFLFAATILPQKEVLLHELRSELRKKKNAKPAI